jgi:hypothetical protein
MAEQTTLEVKQDDTELKLKKIKNINKEIEEIDGLVFNLMHSDVILASGNYPLLTYHYLPVELKNEFKLKVLEKYQNDREHLIKEAESLMK